MNAYKGPISGVPYYEYDEETNVLIIMLQRLESYDWDKMQESLINLITVDSIFKITVTSTNLNPNDELNQIIVGDNYVYDGVKSGFYVIISLADINSIFKIAKYYNCKSIEYKQIIFAADIEYQISSENVKLIGELSSLKYLIINDCNQVEDFLIYVWIKNKYKTLNSVEEIKPHGTTKIILKYDFIRSATSKSKLHDNYKIREFTIPIASMDNIKSKTYREFFEIIKRNNNGYKKCSKACITLLAIKKFRQSILSPVDRNNLLFIAKMIYDSRGTSIWCDNIKNLSDEKETYTDENDTGHMVLKKYSPYFMSRKETP